MSFTTDVCEELIRLPLKKTCCRKAFLLGLMLGAGREEDQICARFYSRSLAELATGLVGKLLHVEVEPIPVLRVGRQTWILTFRAPAVLSFLDTVDRGTDEPVHTAVGFRCASCGAEIQ